MNQQIKYLQLPFLFSTERLQAELNALREKWILHYNKADYDGDWSALPLRSAGGSMTNVFAENRTELPYADTALMQQCPYIKSVVSHFPCEHLSIRLLNLKAGARIKEHKDGELGFEFGEARIHVPITTNPDVAFYLDNERLYLNEGECWYMNFDLPHRIENNGTTDRVHLVIDLVVNDAIRKMFSEVDPAMKKEIPAKKQIREQDIDLVIQNLMEINTPVSLALAENMRRERI